MADIARAAENRVETLRRGGVAHHFTVDQEDGPRNQVAELWIERRAELLQVTEDSNEANRVLLEDAARSRGKDAVFELEAVHFLDRDVLVRPEGLSEGDPPGGPPATRRDDREAALQHLARVIDRARRHVVVLHEKP